jgi:Co/Zn/Cd efflux system component
LQVCLMCADQSADSDLVLRQAVCLVERKYDINHVTVQVERYCAAIMQDCVQCQVLKD